MGSSRSRHNLRDIHWGATGEKSPVLVKSGDISIELCDGAKRTPASRSRIYICKQNIGNSISLVTGAGKENLG